MLPSPVSDIELSKENIIPVKPPAAAAVEPNHRSQHVCD